MLAWSPASASDCCFLLMNTLRGSRWWLKSLGPYQPCRRPRQSSRSLALAWPISDCCVPLASKAANENSLLLSNKLKKYLLKNSIEPFLTVWHIDRWRTRPKGWRNYFLVFVRKYFLHFNCTWTGKQKLLMAFWSHLATAKGSCRNDWSSEECETFERYHLSIHWIASRVHCSFGLEIPEIINILLKRKFKLTFLVINSFPIININSAIFIENLKG